MAILRNIIPVELLENNRVVFEGAQYGQIISSLKETSRLRSPYPAKNINEFFALVETVINDYERRQSISEEAKIVFTEEEPDYGKDQGPTITFNLVERHPGAAGKGPPMGGSVKSYMAILREEIDDPENPGYKRAILGYWHDNEVKFTVWAKTNKVANERALWFEGLMQEYSWYFTSQGVARLLFLKREADFVSDAKGQKLYGRPIHFYVRTETLTTISQKTFELISVGAAKSQ
jgi:hypothetical protein